MAVKTITVTEEAYRRMKSLKMPDESFSELFNRLASEKNVLWKFFGMYPKEGAEKDRKRLKEFRERVTADMEERYARIRQLGSNRGD